MIKLFKHATAAPSNSFHREGDGRMEILRFAVEYIGMKTPLSHRFVGRKKDISGHFGGGTTACTGRFDGAPPLGRRKPELLDFCLILGFRIGGFDQRGL
jgi:hypothetical protein